MGHLRGSQVATHKLDTIMDHEVQQYRYKFKQSTKIFNKIVLESVARYFYLMTKTVVNGAPEANTDYISMDSWKKDVTPLLTQWSYVFLALINRYVKMDGYQLGMEM